MRDACSGRTSCVRTALASASQPRIVRDPAAPGGRIVGGILTELSIVDSPSNKGCGIELLKARADGSAEFIGKAFGSTTKGTDGYCLKCYSRMKTKHPKCRNCGAKNLFHQPKAGPMKKLKPQPKKARRLVAKQMQTDILTKASGSSWPVYNHHQAVTAMLLRDCQSPDSGKREAAKIALAMFR
jgi:ribosomal protein L40E